MGWHNWLMSCSLLQLHSPTLLSSSMAVDGLTAKTGGATAQQQHLPSMCQAPHGCYALSAVLCYRIPGAVCTAVRVKLLFFIPLVVKNENDFAVYCIVLLEFLVFCGTHIVGYPEVCSATLMNM